MPRDNRLDLITPQLERLAPVERRSREILGELGYPAEPDDFPLRQWDEVDRLPEAARRRYRRGADAAMALAHIQLARQRLRRGDREGAMAAASQASLLGADLMTHALRGAKVGASSAEGGRERAADFKERDRQLIEDARAKWREKPHQSINAIARDLAADYDLSVERIRKIIAPYL